MSNGKLSRSTLVDALDNLGERERLAGIWQEETGAPYPPEAVEKRLRRLRWRWKFKQLGSVGVGIVIFAAGLQLIAGGTSHTLLEGAVFGGGVGFAYNAARQWWKDAPDVRSIQLYELLQRIDGTTDAN